jgi:hypothetical protein
MENRALQFISMDIDGKEVLMIKMNFMRLEISGPMMPMLLPQKLHFHLCSCSIFSVLV